MVILENFCTDRYINDPHAGSRIYVVNDTEKIKKRGRPRAFDRDEALEKAQALFHAHGYEGVGVAALAEAMGINPPSLYAAFGSKAALYDEVLARYGQSALPVMGLLTPEADTAEALTALLREAARLYADDSQAIGCMVLEGARGTDADATRCAQSRKAAAHQQIADFVALRHPDKADLVADYMVMLMSGLSADARARTPPDRLRAVADMGGLAIEAMLRRP